MLRDQKAEAYKSLIHKVLEVFTSCQSIFSIKLELQPTSWVSHKSRKISLVNRIVRKSRGPFKPAFADGLIIT
ncbi:hypothetical protein AKJ16_DCAP02813, partial [Drosera capensis]